MSQGSYGSAQLGQPLLVNGYSPMVVAQGTTKIAAMVGQVTTQTQFFIQMIYFVDFLDVLMSDSRSLITCQIAAL